MDSPLKLAAFLLIAVFAILSVGGMIISIFNREKGHKIFELGIRGIIIFVIFTITASWLFPQEVTRIFTDYDKKHKEEHARIQKAITPVPFSPEIICHMKRATEENLKDLGRALELAFSDDEKVTANMKKCALETIGTHALRFPEPVAELLKEEATNKLLLLLRHPTHVVQVSAGNLLRNVHESSITLLASRLEDNFNPASLVVILRALASHGKKAGPHALTVGELVGSSLPDVPEQAIQTLAAIVDPDAGDVSLAVVTDLQTKASDPELSKLKIKIIEALGVIGPISAKALASLAVDELSSDDNLTSKITPVTDSRGLKFCRLSVPNSPTPQRTDCAQLRSYKTFDEYWAAEDGCKDPTWRLGYIEYLREALIRTGSAGVKELMSLKEKPTAGMRGLIYSVAGRIEDLPTELAEEVLKIQGSSEPAWNLVSLLAVAQKADPDGAGESLKKLVASEEFKKCMSREPWFRGHYQSLGPEVLEKSPN